MFLCQHSVILKIEFEIVRAMRGHPLLGWSLSSPSSLNLATVLYIVDFWYFKLLDNH